MLSISQKESILRKAGYRLPPFPVRRLPVQERYLERGVRVPQEEIEADRAHVAAVRASREAIERLYAMHIHRRKSEWRGFEVSARESSVQRVHCGAEA